MQSRKFLGRTELGLYRGRQVQIQQYTVPTVSLPEAIIFFALLHLAPDETSLNILVFLDSFFFILMLSV